MNGKGKRITQKKPINIQTTNLIKQFLSAESCLLLSPPAQATLSAVGGSTSEVERSRSVGGVLRACTIGSGIHSLNSGNKS